MNNKLRDEDIYLMGIGGTAMGAFAGLLKSQGHKVRGSDKNVYSPMKEKLQEWGIAYETPYKSTNLATKPDLVIVGNVVGADNPEVQSLIKQNIIYDSFPSVLYKKFLQNKQRLVITGTHGKTTCSSLIAHTLVETGYDPGFLIGGIPKNFGESFRFSKNNNGAFVIEGDEYDTAYFDKRAKFFHYRPKYLLVTSLEFDHADIYRDLEHIILTFAEFFGTLGPQENIIYNYQDQNIKKALEISKTKAKLVKYNHEKNFSARNIIINNLGSTYEIFNNNLFLGKINTSLFGDHNISNSLGSYVLLKKFGLSHSEISQGFKTFLGVARRLDEKLKTKNWVIIDDFAHHPSAVKSTIQACRQKYSQNKLVAIFEPRSATSCTNIFEHKYTKALSLADEVILAPLGRNKNLTTFLDTNNIARNLNQNKTSAYACEDLTSFKNRVCGIKGPATLLFMSNGNFGGLIKDVFIEFFSDKS